VTFRELKVIKIEFLFDLGGEDIEPGVDPAAAGASLVGDASRFQFMINIGIMSKQLFPVYDQPGEFIGRYGVMINSGVFHLAEIRLVLFYQVGA